MQTAKNVKEYRRHLQKALDNTFQRQAMDKFAVAYRASRANAFAGMDVADLVAQIAAIKDKAAAAMDDLLAAFTCSAQAAGVHVHVAATGAEANRMIADIGKANQVKNIVKSKSMTAEETLLNHHLEGAGFAVTETDLGEWIIQLRGEGPSHMVMPAIHLSRFQVADLFTRVTGKNQESEIERLVRVARRELRQKFVDADMGISGANFALADTGTLGITTNEGNARLVTTLPRVHVALVGLEKLLPGLHEALVINQVLPRNATGQQITSYVTWITGPNACAAAADGRKQMHVVFLDNGRRALAKDPVFSQVLRCVRCGACANVCPVYRMVGGHQYGHIYIGAIGLILTYFFHGREKARNLVQNCLNCGACKAVCAAGIDLPRLIKAVMAKIQDEQGQPIAASLLSRVMQDRRIFHGLLKTAQATQKPLAGDTPYLRHLPLALLKVHDYRAIPVLAEKPFRSRWPAVKPRIRQPRLRVALFAGCLQDFVYPEQLQAALGLLAKDRVEVVFPMDQTCCGLPLEMMGQSEAARQVARQNISAMTAGSLKHVITLCASCASHLKNAYPRLLAQTDQAHTAQAFAATVWPFSVFVKNHVDLQNLPPGRSGPAVTYHAPCHLCRGLDEHQAPKDLLAAAGWDFRPAAEEETCCGFGGTYSAKFPEVSAQILAAKLSDAAATGASVLVTECPGCVLQLRGGALRQGMGLNVWHLVEALHP
jgi:iron-sulfur cluster protein